MNSSYLNKYFLGALAGVVLVSLQVLGEDVSPKPDSYASSRELLVRDISHMGVKDDAVLKALRDVPRHEFVPMTLRFQAYKNQMINPFELLNTFNKAFFHFFEKYYLLSEYKIWNLLGTF